MRLGEEPGLQVRKKLENVWQAKDLQARFLDVWQAKDLAARNSDVWQVKDLTRNRQGSSGKFGEAQIGKCGLFLGLLA
jgi:hypothetical protein